MRRFWIANIVWGVSSLQEATCGGEAGVAARIGCFLKDFSWIKARDAPRKDRNLHRNLITEKWSN